MPRNPANDPEERRKTLEALQASTAAKATPGPSAEHCTDFLYDENGLPRETMTLEDLLGTYETALKNKDLRSCDWLIADDAVFLFSNGSAHIGKAAVLAALKRNFDSIEHDTYHTQDVVWLTRNNDSAVSAYRFAWTGTIAGKAASGGGRGTSVYRRDGEKWVIIHEHLSAGRFA
jgi:ketosteroid isomerase-like protein